MRSTVGPGLWPWRRPAPPPRPPQAPTGRAAMSTTSRQRPRWPMADGTPAPGPATGRTARASVPRSVRRRRAGGSSGAAVDALSIGLGPVITVGTEHQRLGVGVERFHRRTDAFTHARSPRNRLAPVRCRTPNRRRRRPGVRGGAAVRMLKRLVRPLTRRVSPTCNPATSPAEGLSMLASSRRPRRATTTTSTRFRRMGWDRCTNSPRPLTLPGRRSSGGLSARIDRPTVHNAAATATPAATRRRQAYSNTRAATISRTIAADRDAAPRVRRANGPNAAPPSAAVATASAMASPSSTDDDQRTRAPPRRAPASHGHRRSTPPAWRHRCPHLEQVLHLGEAAHLVAVLDGGFGGHRSDAGQLVEHRLVGGGVDV